MDLYNILKEHGAEYHGLPHSYAAPQDLKVGDVVGHGGPWYIITGKPTSTDEVQVQVQHYPDGGFATRVWDKGVGAVIPVLGLNLIERVVHSEEAVHV